MIVKDITDVLEEFAPLSIQEKWDNSGLMIGSPSQEVHGILIGFDCTPELVDEAIQVGADMIITHHPMIFSCFSQILQNNLIHIVFRRPEAEYLLQSVALVRCKK